ncbi:MAG: hypothetical protein P1U42_00830 [Phycisphaerales bacterium]|nr:hypothetical protein [Phycisphaerales bacterium]
MPIKSDHKDIVAIEALAQILRLPIAFLKRETKAGRIPYLRAGNRLRYNPAAVREALALQAAENHNGGAK